MRMDTLPGFSDRFGAELRRRRCLVDICADLAEAFGYEPVSVPIIERAEVYDPAIVGLSPWPEWNPRGCFFLTINDYNDSYSTLATESSVVLIPEGTLSVTRWLGAQLRDEDSFKQLPVKIYYDLRCFRNELIVSLSKTKGRSFSQFGVEILGSSTIEADLEQMVIAHEALVRLGMHSAKVSFRISSNELFISMSNEAGFNHLQRVQIKEHLDTIAECKAGKGIKRFEDTRASLLELIHYCNYAKTKNAFEYIIDRPIGPITSQDMAMLESFSEDAMSRLFAITQSLNKVGISCEVDYCVVRSHEYYTGITFEIDIIGSKCRYVEVGGGGRYDRLLGNFTPLGGPKIVPCVGFAFGVERLQSALLSEGLLSSSAKKVSSVRDLTDDGAVIHIHGDTTESETDLKAASYYMQIVRELREDRLEKRISYIPNKKNR